MLRFAATLLLASSLAAVAQTTKPAPPPAATPAPSADKGGPGADKVWVNTDTKVYHCPGSNFYGKTKNGKYVTEKWAKSEGDKPARGQVCSTK
ncbi:hypothetical protein ACFQBQ_04685 [Granulicella cerasi]|uniref:Uncharacterized protein n=1 Tax=Granulicella cerasi TaxID=741063 RepID=A0ABW1Z6C3_9BACT|nr:hypothetical protein [Granulicella cerasi]